MAHSFSSYALPLITNPTASDLYTVPVLVWEHAGSVAAYGDFDLTLPGVGVNRPKQGEPLVFEVKKADQVIMNAFALGITIGRTPNNDICIPDESVSRFHGYLKLDEKTNQWGVVDAGSKNGTKVGDTDVRGKAPHPLRDHERLTVGNVSLLFLMPAMWLRYARKLVAAP